MGVKSVGKETVVEAVIRIVGKKIKGKKEAVVYHPLPEGEGEFLVRERKPGVWEVELSCIYRNTGEVEIVGPSEGLEGLVLSLELFFPLPLKLNLKRS